MELLSTVRAKLQDGFLTPDELGLWDRVLPALTATQLQQLLEVFTQEQELVRMMTDNLKAKVAAVEHQNLNAWKAALEHELSMVKLVTPNLAT